MKHLNKTCHEIARQAEMTIETIFSGMR